MTRNPHDALFKAVFQHPENAAAELEHILRPELAAAIEWSTLALQPGSYVNAQLADRHSDLLFSARAKTSDRQVLVYLLFEHQSSHEPAMALRLLEYMVAIWDRFGGDHPGEALPVILPAVLAQVPAGWKAATRFSDLFSRDLGPLAGSIPDFSYAVDNLARTADPDLRRRPLANHAGLALWLLRDARDAAALLRSTPTWATSLEALAQAPGGPGALTLLLRYIARVCDDLHLSEFRATLEMQAPTAESLTMTIAEQLHAEGLAKGKAEGLAKGEAEGLLKALHAVLNARSFSVSESLQLRIQACADSDTLQLWLTRAATASKLEDVFGEI